MQNKSYGRIIGEGKFYAFSPAFLTEDCHNPTAEEYAEAGYFPLNIAEPNPPIGKRVASTAYLLVNGEIVASYTYEDIPPRIRRFSKLRLWSALNKRGLWGQFKTWLSAAGLEDAWNLAQELATDYEGWEAIAESAKAVLAVDDDTFNAILTESEEC